jgi:lipopolysaccharide transport system permease protein
MAEIRTISASPPKMLIFLSPLHLIRVLYQYRELIWYHMRRDLALRYRGSYLGWMWSFINPLLSLSVYTFVFGFIMKARFALPAGSGKFAYALILFSGIIVYNTFSSCLAAAPLMVTTKTNYVKKVVFPLEILSITSFAVNFVNTCIGLSILVPASVMITGGISRSIYLFPLVIIPLCNYCLGLTWFISALGVFVRDIRHVVSVFLHLLFFLSAVIYPLAAIPTQYLSVARLNPLITIIENARRTLIFGQSLEWFWWFIATGFSFIVLQIGYLFFMKSKRGFSDVL